MSQELQFIVKVISPDGYVGWLTSPNVNGLRTISTKAGAAVFPTHEQATAAVTDMSPVFERDGVRFSVEPEGRLGSAPATSG